MSVSSDPKLETRVKFIFQTLYTNKAKCVETWIPEKKWNEHKKVGTDDRQHFMMSDH